MASEDDRLSRIADLTDQIRNAATIQNADVVLEALELVSQLVDSVESENQGEFYFDDQLALQYGHVVRFVFLGDDDDHVDFTARCRFLPRIGDRIVPMAGADQVIVTDVIHNFIRYEDQPAKFAQGWINIVCEEPITEEEE